MKEPVKFPMPDNINPNHYKVDVMKDNINPYHYKIGGIETIDFIEAKELNYNLGNAVKYISRAGHKGSRIDDLKKAAWYLQREINFLTETF